jgi:HTH-type transcriptional regulator / antitoxin HigA
MEVIAVKSRTIIRTIKDPSALGSFVMPRNDAEYDAAVDQLDALVDEIGDRPADPRYRLIETLSVLIEAYDDRHSPMPDVSGADMLRFLMQQHGLAQNRLPEVGSQGVVSEILSGQRQLNVRQIRALAERFGVEPGAFISADSGSRGAG